MVREGPEFVVPQVKTDGIMLQASGGQELVFTKIELVADGRLLTVKFIVGNNSLSVMVARATAHDLLDKLEQVLEV